MDRAGPEGGKLGITLKKSWNYPLADKTLMSNFNYLKKHVYKKLKKNC